MASAPLTGAAWADALIAQVKVRPWQVGGLPGLAILFPEPFGVARDSLVYSGAIHGLHLVEAPSGGFRLGVSTHRFPHTVTHVPDTGQKDRMHPLVAWLAGYAAWDALINSQSGEAAEFLDEVRVGLDRHFARLVSEALPHAGFAPHVLQALRSVQGWGWGPSEGVEKLFKPTLKAATLRRFVRRNPFITEIAYAETVALATHDRDPDLSVVMPGLSQGALRKLRSPAWAAEAMRHGVLTGHEDARRHFQDYLPHVPSDWLPTDRAGVRAFLKVYRLIQGFGFEAIPAAQLIRSCGGDWAGFYEACMKASGGILEGIRISSYLADPVNDLAVKLVAPLIERARMPAKAKREMPSPHVLAWRLVYRDKSLPGCIEASRRWHARLPRLLAELPHEADDGKTWPALYPETRIGDLVVVPLTDSVSLAEEGDAGPDRNGVPGLDHCSASYRSDAWRGDAHVFSVRRVHADGGYERLATFEMAGNGNGFADVIQISGHGNAQASGEATNACKEFAELHRDTKRPRRPQRTSGDEVREDCGFDWRDDATMARAYAAYGFMLPRDLRGDMDALTTRIKLGGNTLAK